MTEGRTNWDCDACSADLAELALGVLTGRERARALAHVDTCPRCADQLEQLSRAADAVLLAAPAQEPPMGFEVELFDRMGVRAVTPSRWDRFAWTPRRVTATVTSAAAAVAALGVGLGVGLSSQEAPQSSSPPITEAPASPSHMDSAKLTAHDGRTVGHIVYSEGTKPWMAVMLADPGAQGIAGTYTCKVVDKHGVTHTVGTLVAKDGYGAWYAPLRINPNHLSRAEVVSSSGAVIATATLD